MQSGELIAIVVAMPERWYVLAFFMVVCTSALNVLGKLWVWVMGGKYAETRAYKTIIAFAEREFARIDADGDGAIDAHDIAAYFTRVDGIGPREALNTAQKFMRVGRQC